VPQFALRKLKLEAMCANIVPDGSAISKASSE
jgi:hypothetical protein